MNNLGGLQPGNSGPRSRGRPFQPGQSGNPAGRRKGDVSPTAALRRALTRKAADALARVVIARATAGDAVCLRLVFERLDGPVSAMNVECFADATFSPRVEFCLPDNGRDAADPRKMTDQEIEALLVAGVKAGVPELLFAQSDRCKALLAASRPQDASQTGNV